MSPFPSTDRVRWQFGHKEGLPWVKLPDKSMLFYTLVSREPNRPTDGRSQKGSRPNPVLWMVDDGAPGQGQGSQRRQLSTSTSPPGVDREGLGDYAGRYACDAP